MTMRVSSFKPQCRQAPLHYPTPPRPVYEAFSPVLRPSDTPAEPPASGNDIESTNGVVSAIQHAGSTEKSGRAPSPLSLQPVAHELPPLKPHFSPALGSPIDALANVAASSLETSPVYPAPAGGPSRGLVSPTFAFARPHTREREPKHALPYPDSASTHDERPSKRARSEFFPSPFQSQQHSRPSTSHNPGWSYNVEQMADNGRRMYQESAAPAYYQQQQENQSKRLSDAQLLIDFAVRAETSVQPHVSNRHRWSSGHTTSSAENTLHTGKHSNSLHLAVPYHSVPPVNRAMPRDYEPHAHPNEAGPNGYLPNPIHLPSAQTHTPPEEHWNTGGLHTIDSEEKKPKKHQGWPKGKPRGPRNASATDRKKKTLPRPEDVPATVIMNQPTSEQLHSPQSPPKAPVAPLQNDLDLIAALQQTPSAPVLQSRRLSFSETSPPGEQSSHDISASARAQSVPVQTNTIASAATDEASSMGMGKKCDLPQVTICAGCHSTDSATSIGDGEQWISCDGCKEWFHYACAGFKSQREVRAIDKFYCEGCKPKFGNTTSKFMQASLAGH
jgi:F-box/leucine-rich repeat protein 10/11